MKKERAAEITGTFSIACYEANEKGYKGWILKK